MHRSSRFNVLLVAVAVLAGACSAADAPLQPKLSPSGFKPSMARVRATDSSMALTDISYSDTATLLKRTTPLATDLTVTALIGSTGGSLQIDAAGVKVDIPPHALSAPTQITMTARKGDNVAYEFGPHGTVFAAPVKVTQDLSVTAAYNDAARQAGMHAAYFDTSLDSAFTDATKQHAHIKENQLSYKESATQIRFYVGHFSGYLVSMGAF